MGFTWDLGRNANFWLHPRPAVSERLWGGPSDPIEHALLESWFLGKRFRSRGEREGMGGKSLEGVREVPEYISFKRHTFCTPHP